MDTLHVNLGSCCCTIHGLVARLKAELEACSLSADMLSWFKKAAPDPPVDISLCFDEPLAFLYAGAASAPSHLLPKSTSIRMTVVLDVKRPAVFDSLKLHYRVCWRDKSQKTVVNGVLKEQVRELLAEERTFTKGQHAFPLTIEEYCTDAPDCTQCDQYDHAVYRQQLIELSHSHCPASTVSWTSRKYVDCGPITETNLQLLCLVLPKESQVGDLPLPFNLEVQDFQ
jgi:hypothetical protein